MLMFFHHAPKFGGSLPRRGPKLGRNGILAASWCNLGPPARGRGQILVALGCQNGGSSPPLAPRPRPKLGVFASAYIQRGGQVGDLGPWGSSRFVMLVLEQPSMSQDAEPELSQRFLLMSHTHTHEVIAFRSLQRLRSARWSPLIGVEVCSTILHSRSVETGALEAATGGGLYAMISCAFRMATAIAKELPPPNGARYARCAVEPRFRRTCGHFRPTFVATWPWRCRSG